MRITIEISDELFKKTRAVAASRGESLREFVSAAIRARLASTITPIATGSGWRSVFGLADPKSVQRVDAVIESAFEQIDPAAWR
ncbi:MAG TPA: hypothetical protein VNN25_13110 [Thermoanaerobaculia bacterium]|nr:hypothetical protein [Thermoanaerobaculia bacterium]